jgi:cold shock CspA family protein
MNDEELRAQIEVLIRDEIQDVINSYVEEQNKSSDESGIGFITPEEQKEMTVKIKNVEIDKLMKEYKQIKKEEKSNISEIKKLGLVDKFGNPLD